MQRLERTPDHADLVSEAPQGLVKAYEPYLSKLDDPRKAYFVLVGVPDSMARYLLSRFHQLHGQAFVNQILAMKAAQTVPAMVNALLERVVSSHDVVVARDHFMRCLETLDERSLAVAHDAFKTVHIKYHLGLVGVSMNRTGDGQLSIDLPLDDPRTSRRELTASHIDYLAAQFREEVIRAKTDLHLFPTMLERLGGGYSANVEDNRFGQLDKLRKKIADLFVPTTRTK